MKHKKDCRCEDCQWRADLRYLDYAGYHAIASRIYRLLHKYRKAMRLLERHVELIGQPDNATNFSNYKLNRQIRKLVERRK